MGNGLTIRFHQNYNLPQIVYINLDLKYNSGITARFLKMCPEGIIKKRKSYLSCDQQLVRLLLAAILDPVLQQSPSGIFLTALPQQTG